MKWKFSDVFNLADPCACHRAQIEKHLEAKTLCLPTQKSVMRSRKNRSFEICNHFLHTKVATLNFIRMMYLQFNSTQKRNQFHLEHAGYFCANFARKILEKFQNNFRKVLENFFFEIWKNFSIKKNLKIQKCLNCAIKCYKTVYWVKLYSIPRMEIRRGGKIWKTAERCFDAL